MAAKEETLELPSTPAQGMIRVWDKDGKPHDMLRLNANDMVQHNGWFDRLPGSRTNGSPPETKVVVVVSKKAPPSPFAESDGSSEQIDLHSLTQEALVAFAKEHFDMDFDATVAREAIIDAILQEKSA